MDKLNFNWVRIWEPHSPTATGEADGDNRRSTDELPRLPCLVLLGPPGSGKTTELQRLERNAQARGEITRTVNLRYISSADELRNELQGVLDAAFGKPDVPVAVFLDGLDEIPAKIDVPVRKSACPIFEHIAHFTARIRG